MKDYLITYQKANGDILKRYRNKYPSFRAGDTTSMGWKVLNIEYLYNGKYYDKNTQMDLIHKEIKKEQNKRLFFISIKKYLNKFATNIILLEIMLVLQGLIGQVSSTKI